MYKIQYFSFFYIWTRSCDPIVVNAYVQGQGQGPWWGFFMCFGREILQNVCESLWVCVCVCVYECVCVCVRGVYHFKLRNCRHFWRGIYFCIYTLDLVAHISWEGTVWGCLAEWQQHCHDCGNNVGNILRTMGTVWSCLSKRGWRCWFQCQFFTITREIPGGATASLYNKTVAAIKKISVVGICAQSEWV